MREPADPERIRLLAAELGRAAPVGTRLYLVGGATAVFEGWRQSANDVDLLIEPETDQIMRAIARLENEPKLNIETASPLDFLPPLPGWRERSRSRFRAGNIEVFDLDLYSQVLVKLERGFALDLEDIRSMLGAGLVARSRLLELLVQIEPVLFRFPAVDPAGFRRRVGHMVG